MFHPRRAEPGEPPDFAAVFRLLDERCLECHTQTITRAGSILETHDALMKGGETGTAIEPGKSAESLLMKYVRGEVEKDGKKKIHAARQTAEARRVGESRCWRRGSTPARSRPRRLGEAAGARGPEGRAQSAAAPTP